MAWLPLRIISIFLISSSFCALFASAANDTLAPGMTVSGNQTLLSDGGAFALGFFTLGGGSAGSSRRYLGIWYGKIPKKTVVWVANRDKPVADPSAVLTMTSSRNIALLDSNGTLIWSSGATTVPNGTVAVLLDTGNLVLRQKEGGELWQSFDNPTDTFLPEMKLRSNLRTGEAQRIVAWKSPQDPSPGNFSLGVDPATSLQIITWRGTQPFWRSHVWNGKSLSGAREASVTASQYVITVTSDADEMAISFSRTRGSAPARYTIDPAGTLKMLVWAESLGDWFLVWSRPSQFCDAYDRCGPSGLCDSSGGTPTCRCLEGFVPRNQTAWDRKDFSGGCVWKVPLQCDKSDKFWKAERMKLPDRLRLVANKTEEQCQSECLFSCMCTAYASANISEGPGSTRCLVWVGDLLDLETVENGGEDLYVRLVASEIVNDASDVSSDVDKRLLLILLPTLVTGVVLLGVAVFLLRRRIVKQRKLKMCEAVLFADLRVSSTLVDRDTAEVPLIDFSIIMAATNNFSTANKLGEGGFGPVYKGLLSQDREIAVKRLSKGSGQGFQEFKNEVELIARLQHTNLVRLLGWCTHENEKLLIYEYLPNKSLDKFIFDLSRSSELQWQKRFHIIEGIAQGLLYLHRYSRLHVIHRDLKTSNILLDGEMNPKISDFGLARIFGGNQTEANTSKVVGTYGYMAPEYALDGVFSDKSDIFSFGVIILEIITGKRSTGFYPYRECLNLLGYAWQLWEEGRSLELVDSSIESTIHAPEVLKCVKLGLLCVQENAADRPTTTSIVQMLNNENATMPPPNRPGFAIGRQPNPVNTNSTSSSKESVNYVTMSVVDGR